jgi:hypothetical protein
MNKHISVITVKTAVTIKVLEFLSKIFELFFILWVTSNTISILTVYLQMIGGLRNWKGFGSVHGVTENI